MAVVKINAERFIRGKVSITRRRNDELEMKVIETFGILATHDYIEHIDTIETERYLLSEVDVYQEDFGSNDYNIVYSFKANNLIIKDDYIPDKVKEVIEYELYKDENEEYFHADNFEDGLEKYEEMFNFSNDYHDNEGDDY